MLARIAPYAAAVAAISLMLAGCASQMPDVRPEADAAYAAGLQSGEAIVFHSELPDDAPDEVETLSLASVLRLTAQNSSGIQTAVSRVRIAQAEAKQSRLLPNPLLSLALRFPKRGAAIIDADLSADLIAILRRPGTINAADSRLRATSAETLTIVLDELSTAQERYFTIQSLEASIAVLNQRRVLLDRLLSLADSRLRIGEGTRLDVVTLQTQRVELEAEIADGELQLRDERLALARLIGQPTSEANWSVPKWTSPTLESIDEDSSVRTALDHRPEVRQRTWELAAFGYEQKLAGWSVLNGTEVGVAAERDGDWSVGPSASLPIPLLDMGQAQRERALAAVIGARHELTTARRQVIEDVRRALATLRASRKNLDRVKNELLPLQEDRLKQAEAQFRAGQTDITGLLIAEQDMQTSRSRFIEVQRSVSLAMVRLHRAVGGAGIAEEMRKQASTRTANATTAPTTR